MPPEQQQQQFSHRLHSWKTQAAGQVDEGEVGGLHVRRNGQAELPPTSAQHLSGPREQRLVVRGDSRL